MDDPRAHSLRQASRRYGVARDTLAAAIRAGELPASRPGRRRLVILDDDLRAWLARHRVRPQTVAARVEAALAREGRMAP